MPSPVVGGSHFMMLCRIDIFDADTVLLCPFGEGGTEVRQAVAATNGQRPTSPSDDLAHRANGGGSEKSTSMPSASRLSSSVS
jgi:hypothetical protein